MEKWLDILKTCSLFDGIAGGDILSVLHCLSVKEKDYGKDAIVCMAGEAAGLMGIVLTGSVTVVKDDFWGNRTIIGKMETGELFAETFAFTGGLPLPFSVVSTEKSTLMFINYQKLITTCPSACAFHTRLIGNMAEILAKKNAMLAQKMEHLSCRTTSEKLLSYLSAQARKGNGNSFRIPFNRQELADFLSVDRSAMSTELGKLRDEGVLAFRKNRFRLYQNPEKTES